MMKYALVLLFVLFVGVASAQQLFSIQYNDCNTDMFALEKDSVVADTDLSKFDEIILERLENKDMKGDFMLQILVDLEGNSCLLSMQNNTNLRDKDLKFIKEKVDRHLYWNKPFEKVSVIFSFKLDGKKLVMQRWGFDMKKGLHKIDLNRY